MWPNMSKLGLWEDWESEVLCMGEDQERAEWLRKQHAALQTMGEGGTLEWGSTGGIQISVGSRREMRKFGRLS